MIKKNTAFSGFVIGCFISTTDGSEVIVGTPTCKRILDGTAATCVNQATASYDATLGAWTINLDAADLNGDAVGFVFKMTGCQPITYSLHTVTGIPDANGNFPTITLTDANGIETDVSLKQAIQIIGAAVAGINTGNTFLGLDKTTTRITGVVDAATGNRTNATTYNI